MRVFTSTGVHGDDVITLHRGVSDDDERVTITFGDKQTREQITIDFSDPAALDRLAAPAAEGARRLRVVLAESEPAGDAANVA